MLSVINGFIILVSTMRSLLQESPVLLMQHIWDRREKICQRCPLKIYHMDHMIWSIRYGLFQINYLIWLTEVGVGWTSPMSPDEFSVQWLVFWINFMECPILIESKPASDVDNTLKCCWSKTGHIETLSLTFSIALNFQ